MTAAAKVDMPKKNKHTKITKTTRCSVGIALPLTARCMLQAAEIIPQWYLFFATKAAKSKGWQSHALGVPRPHSRCGLCAKRWQQAIDLLHWCNVYILQVPHTCTFAAPSGLFILISHILLRCILLGAFIYPGFFFGCSIAALHSNPGMWSTFKCN